jgi:hypothetical protein
VIRRWPRREIVCFIGVMGSATLLAQDPGTRAIVPEAFLKARPTGGASTTNGPASYRVVDRPKPATLAKARGETVDVGVTIWRLRPAKAGEAVRLLVQVPDAAAKEWTPERIGVGTPLAVGDRVRLSIESPRAGYLYVIDREQYADGTLGAPFLVFPTTRTRAGDNRVSGGRLIDIPAQDDRPPYFTVKPSRSDQTGERLTLLITDAPLADVTIGAQPVQLTATQMANWESRGSESVQRLEMVGGVGRAWSRAEQRAAADGTRLLTQEDPSPQTLFRMVVGQPDLIVVNVTLPQSRGTTNK